MTFPVRPVNQKAERAQGQPGYRSLPQEVDFMASRIASRALSSTAAKGPASMLATGVLGVDGWGERRCFLFGVRVALPHLLQPLHALLLHYLRKLLGLFGFSVAFDLVA